jgi:hypothetical protein
MEAIPSAHGTFWATACGTGCARLRVSAGTAGSWQLFLGHGLFIGLLGNGSINAPFYVDVSKWFDRWRGAALALVSSGSYAYRIRSAPGDRQGVVGTFRSPAGCSAARNSMLSDQAPTPPWFIGHRMDPAIANRKPEAPGARSSIGQKVLPASAGARGTAVPLGNNHKPSDPPRRGLAPGMCGGAHFAWQVRRHVPAHLELAPDEKLVQIISQNRSAADASDT